MVDIWYLYVSIPRFSLYLLILKPYLYELNPLPFFWYSGTHNPL